jgi:formylglycine-generating enzyme required for sulfatase activity
LPTEAFGVLDMGGNVSEWTQSQACRPGGSCDKDRWVVRGGSWRSCREAADRIRATWRHYTPDTAHDALGIRCAVSLK